MTCTSCTSRIPLSNPISTEEKQRHTTKGKRCLPMYRLSTFSTCLPVKRPLMTSRPWPSTEPVVPISAKRNWITCSGCRCMRLQISVTFANTDFLLPSRWIDGGAMVKRFPEEESSAGLAACRAA